MHKKHKQHKKNETLLIDINNNNNTEFYTKEMTKKMDICFTFISGYAVYGGKIVVKIVTFVIQVSGVYLMWILLHYFASQLYVKLCTPNDFVGLLMSPFLTSTPYCQGLRWLIYNGASMINNMWIVLATWFCANIFILHNANVQVNNT